MKILFKCRFGSHLYGTDTPDSDIDIKGVYLPSFEDVVLGRIKKSIYLNTKVDANAKNTKDDVDEEYYSLQHFLELICKGETFAFDMLHCNKENTLASSAEWGFIQRNRELFYSKDMTAFTEYALRQTAKYSIKGSRLDAIRDTRDTMRNIAEVNPNARLKDVPDELDGLIARNPEYCSYHASITPEFTIGDKKMQLTAKVAYFYAMLEKYYNSYGHRAIQAMENKGIDFKAVSHCLRAIYQLEEIVLTGNLRYPLAKAEFLRDVKIGKKHFVNDGIKDLIEDKFQEVKKLITSSNFREKVDTSFWERFIIDVYSISLRKELLKV